MMCKTSPDIGLLTVEEAARIKKIFESGWKKPLMTFLERKNIVPDKFTGQIMIDCNTGGITKFRVTNEVK